MDSAHAVTVEGSLLGGRFTLVSEPTTGSLPHAAVATHDRLPGRFLLSLMPTAACTSPEAAQALVVAARRAISCTHLGLVPVVDAGTISEPMGTQFVAEPLLEGPTLAGFLADYGFITLREVVGLVTQLADALGTAHQAGLVHGELHPRLIQLEGSESDPKARIRGVGWSEETTTARGSQEASAYRAPEHVGRLGGGDPLADQYALGVIAYELLAGCLPFTSESADLADAMALRDRIAPAIAELVPDVPDEVDAVIRKALAFAPSQRHADIRSFAQALAALLGEGEAEVATPPPASEGLGSSDVAATPAPDSDLTTVSPRTQRLKQNQKQKQKRTGRKKRAANIHPSATEFEEDDGPTALENPATLIAAHRVLEASFEASAVRPEPVAAPGLTPPKDPNAISSHDEAATPPPLARGARWVSGQEDAATPPPHPARRLDMPVDPAIPASTAPEEALMSGPILTAPSILPPPAPPPPAPHRKSWPLIAGGGLLLGGLAVWMLISLLKRPATPEELPSPPSQSDEAGSPRRPSP